MIKMCCLWYIKHSTKAYIHETKQNSATALKQHVYMYQVKILESAFKQLVRRWKHRSLQHMAMREAP